MIAANIIAKKLKAAQHPPEINQFSWLPTCQRQIYKNRTHTTSSHISQEQQWTKKRVTERPDSQP
jgi:hypothetical protein